MKIVRTLKIVLASPSDVELERQVLSKLVDELNKQVATDYSLRLELYRWETDAYPGFHVEGPQGVIDSNLGIDESDLFICIFWKRFGTPTKDSASGTAHEFNLAYQAWKVHGKPRIMLYFGQLPYIVQSKDEVEQLGRLIEFQQGLPPEGLWWKYRDLDDFERLARNHLTKYIREMARSITAQTVDESISGRSLDELLNSYRSSLLQQVSTLRLFDGTDLQLLEKVFVDLTITEEYERPLIHNAWLSLVDAQLRRKRDVLGNDDESSDLDSRDRVVKIKRTINPKSLLRQHTQAVITGAPGCGKTTLIKYLALKTLTENNRLPILLELKTVTKQRFFDTKQDLVALLFEHIFADRIQFDGEAERQRLHAFFIDRLKKGEVAIFLDGLDEVRAEDFFPALCKSVNAFMRSAYRSNDLIITTRPYALETRFEGLLEMEIAPLSQSQIQDFLDHYYVDSPEVRRLPKLLRHHRDLSDLCRVPFLLGVIAELFRHQGEVVGARLELYRQIVKRLVVKLDKEKLVTRFLVEDEAGLLKRDLLKRVAYERLFVDQTDKDIERLVFTDDDLLDKAVKYCRPDVSPNHLVRDVIATPLLREVGTDTYAFAHLTIQEYLAAEALCDQSNVRQLFVQKSFNSTIVTMEVLPMALGLMSDPDPIYKDLEQLPDSLTLTLLRLRIRGLAYSKRVGNEGIARIFARVQELITGNDVVDIAYRESVFRNLASASHETLDSFMDVVEDLLGNAKTDSVRLAVIHFLRQIETMRAFNLLVNIAESDVSYDVKEAAKLSLSKIPREDLLPVSQLESLKKDFGQPAEPANVPIMTQEEMETLYARFKGQDPRDRRAAARKLVEIASPTVVDYLCSALSDKQADVRLVAVAALGKIRPASAVDQLRAVLNDTNREVQKAAAVTLRKVIAGTHESAITTVADRQGRLSNVADSMSKASELALARQRIHGVVDEKTLLAHFYSADPYLRRAAADVLVKLGAPSIVDAFCEGLSDRRADVRLIAIVALGKIGNPLAIENLLQSLKPDNPVVLKAVTVTLLKIGGENAMRGLIAALTNPAPDVRSMVAESFGKHGRTIAVDALLEATVDREPVVRTEVARALGKIGDNRAVEQLIKMLADPDQDVLCAVAVALGKIGDPRSARPLTAVLQKEHSQLRALALDALGKIGDVAVVNDLCKAVNDPDYEVRLAATQALRSIGNSAAIDCLLSALLQRKNETQKLAARALGDLGSRRATQGLKATLQSENLYARRAAAEALGKIGDPNAVNALLEALNDPFSETRWAAAEALGKIGDQNATGGLVRVLHDIADEVRRAAAEALGKLGNKNALVSLLSTLGDIQPSVRNAAARALLSMFDENVIPGLLQAFSRRNEVAILAAATLGRVDDELLERGLKSALSHSEVLVRLRAVKAVGYYSNDPQVLEKLLQIAATDDSVETKSAAAQAAHSFRLKLDGLP